MLVEVNVAREEGKSGVDPDDARRRIGALPGARRGPHDHAAARPSEPEDSRRWFAALAELAGARGLRHLSMGTSQDYLVAVAGGRDDRASRHDAVPVRDEA